MNIRRAQKFRDAKSDHYNGRKIQNRKMIKVAKVMEMAKMIEMAKMMKVLRSKKVTGYLAEVTRLEKAII